MFKQLRFSPIQKRAAMASPIGRMIRAAKLDVGLYEEVEADTGATGQAMLVVVLSSVADWIWIVDVWDFRFFRGMWAGGMTRPQWLVFVALISLVAWYIWAFLTYFIGTRLMPESHTEADVGQLLRTTGFSTSPGLLQILCILPGLIGAKRWTGIVLLGCAVWKLVAMVIAVRQALDYHSTGRAIAVCLVGWLLKVFIVSRAWSPEVWFVLDAISNTGLTRVVMFLMQGMRLD